MLFPGSGFHTLLVTIIWFHWPSQTPVTAAKRSLDIPDTPATSTSSIDSRFLRSAGYNLTSYLFGTGYNPAVRPVLNVSQPVTLSVQMTLITLDAVDIKKQLMKQTVYHTFSWTDEFLTWNPADYGGLETVLVRREFIWTPDITVVKRVGASALHLDHLDVQAQVNSDGTVLWVPTFSVETECDVDIARYPYDRQVCEWFVYPWASNGRMVRFDRHFRSDGYMNIHNAEWEIVNVVNVSCDFMYYDQYFACIQYKYTLQRRSLFLTLALIVPIVLLAMLTPLVFYLPAESGERVSLVVTLMLAFTLFLSIFMDVLPRSSLQASFLMVYLVFLSSCSAVSASLTVVVLSLYHKPDRLPLTGAARVLASCLAFAQCMKVPTPPRNQRLKAATQHQADNCRLTLEAQNSQAVWNYSSSNDCVCDKKEDKTQVEIVADHGSPELTWRHVAAGCDVFFFRLFFSLIVFATGACFLLITGAWKLSKELGEETSVPGSTSTIESDN